MEFFITKKKPEKKFPVVSLKNTTARMSWANHYVYAHDQGDATTGFQKGFPAAMEYAIEDGNTIISGHDADKDDMWHHYGLPGYSFGPLRGEVWFSAGPKAGKSIPYEGWDQYFSLKEEACAELEKWRKSHAISAIPREMLK